ncbi:MAG: DUF1540 domain-containing protein [Firmicutes bacterium]|nr:DUF1540 domain-containing protein [Bacillota bacterium]
MAIILCDVSGCRYQSRQRCTLTGIQIAVGPVRTSAVPDALESQVQSLAGNSRRGYASEFLAYAQYAESMAEEQTQAGAICYSFAPL